MSLSDLSGELARVRMREKEKEFLGTMDRAIPWAERIKLIRSSCYKGERSNAPYRLDWMTLRLIYSGIILSNNDSGE